MPNPLLTPSFGDDAGFRDIGIRLKDIDRQVRELRAGVGSFGAVYNSSGVRITQGGSLTIDGGGTITGTTGGKKFFELSSADGTMQGQYLKIVDVDQPSVWADVVRDVDGQGIRWAGYPSGAQLQFYANATFLTGSPVGGAFPNFLGLFSDGGSSIHAKNFYVNTTEEIRIIGTGDAMVQSDDVMWVRSVNGAVNIYADGDDLNLWAHGETSMALGAGGRIFSASVRDKTTTAAANMVIDAADGTFMRTTSSERYKTDIQPLTLTSAQVLAMDPVTWVDETTPGRVPGFTVEQVESVAGDVLTYGGDSLMYDRIPALHQIVLRDLDRRLKALEAK